MNFQKTPYYGHGVYFNQTLIESHFWGQYFVDSLRPYLLENVKW